ncbi:LysM peptidoglycan-binding domain-containing protein [Arthrobacter sp. Br18]|uniref:LysM peptidoglycan-binding domain-containing protein n=1 Tax=Arthrobacter sp. Br18 TaxID=1312954 RepID=UPI000479402F|nr:LysM peptidoglycan-binding domain-containing protein [Arthrobacter sp. Br18]
MSEIFHAPRHRSTPTLARGLKSASKAVNTHAGAVGRPAAALAAASALMLGVGASAQASASAEPAAAAAASTPAPAPAASAAPEAVAGATNHTVQPGDTLNAIATQYGVGLQNVFSQNGLGASSIIYPGDSIIVSGSGNSVAPAPGSTVPAASDPAVPAVAASPVNLASSAVTEIPGTSTNSAVLASAQSQLGAGQDCTILGEQALKAAGVSGVGDESPAGLMEFATPVSNPQPGDFIYYQDGGAGVPHNAVYIGDGKAIHSGFNGGQTVVNSADIGSGPSYYRVNA